MFRQTLDAWKLTGTYFVLVSVLFGSAAVISMQPHGAVDARLVGRQGDSNGVADVVSSVRSGNLGDFGLAALMFVGPASEMFRSSSMLRMTAGVLLLVALALLGRHRVGF